ncbi:FAD-binding oxidoreductase [Candidatus Marsarchaeota archaeon]|nr:FAD-binding oxidoreductase [Candidatus Marsarchaeota archaeon]
MDKTKNIAIVGAGINGMFCAYYLLKSGNNVTIIDKDREGLTSKNNAGLLTPSLSPIPKVSNLDMIKAMTIGNGALYISPYQIIKNSNWFIKAGKYINKEYNMEKFVDLGMKSLELYREFLNKEKIDADLINGVAALYKNEEEAKILSKKYNGKFINQKQINESGYQNFSGGILFDKEMSVNPVKLFDALRNKINEMGSRIVLGNEAKLILGQSGNAISYIEAGGEKIKADKYVIASGSWSNALSKPVKYNPHIIPARGFAILFSTDNNKIVSMPSLLEDYGIAVAQHNKNLVRITSFFELVGTKNNLEEKRKKWLLNTIKSHLKEYNKMKIISINYGFRPCTPNNLPVIGKVNENVFVASGQCRLGVTLAPITGYIITQLINNNDKNVKKYKWLENFVRN